MRVSLRDSASAKVGSANQFIEIPDLKKNQLAISGLILENFTESEWKGMNTGTAAAKQTRLKQNTSLRRFKRGTILSYSTEIYNAKRDSGQQTQLLSQVRMFRDGKLVLDGKPNTLRVDDPNQRRVTYSGALGLWQRNEAR